MVQVDEPVPVREKSFAARPVTDWVKMRLQVRDEELVRVVVGANEETEGPRDVIVTQPWEEFDPLVRLISDPEK